MKKSILMLICFVSFQTTIGQVSIKNEDVFQEFKTLYEELLGFKGNKDFKKYGFAGSYPYKKWLKKVQILKRNPNSKSLISKGFVVEELETLGFAYVTSKGQETDITIFFNKIFSNAISAKN